MADYLGDFNAIADAQREQKRARDLDDYHNELQGNMTGRMPRFLSAEAREALIEGKTGQTSKSSFSALDWLLLNNPEFMLAYERAMDALVEAEEVVQTALEDAIANAAGTQRDLDALIDKAMHLPDGRAVFMDQLGMVRDESGDAIDPALAATLEWQGHEPSYEDYAEAFDTDNKADATVLTIRQDQAELGDIREQLDATRTVERAEELMNRSNELKARYQEESPAPETVPQESLSVAKLNLSS
jgi:hypothetical protein